MKRGVRYVKKEMAFAHCHRDGGDREENDNGNVSAWGGATLKKALTKKKKHPGLILTATYPPEGRYCWGLPLRGGTISCASKTKKKKIKITNCRAPLAPRKRTSKKNEKEVKENTEKGTEKETGCRSDPTADRKSCFKL